MSYSPCFLEPAIHRICHHLLEGLFFFLCRGTNIYNFFGVHPNFKARTTALYTFHFFLFFLSGFFYYWCERNTGRHFIGFY